MSEGTVSGMGVVKRILARSQASETIDAAEELMAGGVGAHEELTWKVCRGLAGAAQARQMVRLPPRPAHLQLAQAAAGAGAKEADVVGNLHQAHRHLPGGQIKVAGAV